jgi:F-type H+-transporting ATPase subunit b
MEKGLVAFFGQTSSGIGAFGINIQSLVIQLVTFLLVFWVLKRFAFKPILQLLQKRREIIENGVKYGVDIKRQHDELKEEIEAEFHQARLNADKIIESARHEAHAIIDKAEEAARMNADIILLEANQRIKQEQIRLRRQVEQETVGLIIEATESIIKEKIDPIKDAELIDRALQESQLL